MYRIMTPTTRQSCGGVAPVLSGWTLLGLAAIVQRPATKHNSPDERNFHWRDR
jgi:hypothetical protein